MTFKIAKLKKVFSAGGEPLIRFTLTVVDQGEPQVTIHGFLVGPDREIKEPSIRAAKGRRIQIVELAKAVREAVTKTVNAHPWVKELPPVPKRVEESAEEIEVS
jgi:hypothetical protein